MARLVCLRFGKKQLRERPAAEFCSRAAGFFFFPPAGEVQRGWLPACSASLPRGVMWKRSGDASWVPRKPVQEEQFNF